MQDLDEGNGEDEHDQAVFDEDDATMVKEHVEKRTFTSVNLAKKTKTLARGYGAGARHQPFGKGSGG